MKTIKAHDQFDEPVTDAVLEQAIKRGRKLRDSGVHATFVRYITENKLLLIGLEDQSAVALPVKNYPEFANLSAGDLAHLVIGFGGSALCLDKHDLHVSIAGMLSASRSMMEMAATVIAARNGSRTSITKSRTSRENGKLGGRPRKLEVAG